MKTRRKTGPGRAQKAARGKRPSLARQSGTPRVAALAADCTIAQSAAIKAQLARLMGAPAAVTLDLHAVRRIDTAGLQVLAAFIRERRTAGRIVECQGASESFSVTASLLGLGALFSPVMGNLLRDPAARRA
jgi:ABC-type transporter Mla MlaB component